MPELVPIWSELVKQAGGSDEVARMLALYCPTPYLSGCSQAFWTRSTPLLVRNYDYDPFACEGTFLKSNWLGTRVIAASDCLWGAVDGMNEHGVAVALAFGGRRALGDGFGIPLILRYVLETCATTKEAVAVLKRVPSNMAYNVSVLDAAGERAIVFVGPDRKPVLARREVATNHQQSVEWARYERLTRSTERLKFLEAKLRDKNLDTEAFVSLFLSPPLFKTDYHHAFGTVYTATYSPETGKATFLWPGARIVQSMKTFKERELVVHFAGV